MRCSTRWRCGDAVTCMYTRERERGRDMVPAPQPLSGGGAPDLSALVCKKQWRRPLYIHQPDPNKLARSHFGSDVNSSTTLCWSTDTSHYVATGALPTCWHQPLRPIPPRLIRCIFQAGQGCRAFDPTSMALWTGCASMRFGNSQAAKSS